MARDLVADATQESGRVLTGSLGLLPSPSHFVGGVLGSLLVGFFGDEAVNSIGADGVFFGGGFSLLGDQVLALVVVIAFSFVVTWLIATAIEHTLGLRVTPSDEESLDEVQQAMRAYDDSPFASSSASAVAVPPVAPDPVRARQDLRLIAAVVDARAMDVNLLTDSLLSAGAQQIVSTDAHVYTASADSQVVRGERRQRQGTPRTRLEVVAGSDLVGPIVEALRAHTGTAAEVFVLVTDDAP